jgi:hypothetical protein
MVGKSCGDGRLLTTRCGVTIMAAHRTAARAFDLLPWAGLGQKPQRSRSPGVQGCKQRCKHPVGCETGRFDGGTGERWKCDIWLLFGCLFCRVSVVSTNNIAAPLSSSSLRGTFKIKFLDHHGKAADSRWPLGSLVVALRTMGFSRRKGCDSNFLLHPRSLTSQLLLSLPSFQSSSSFSRCHSLF